MIDATFAVGKGTARKILKGSGGAPKYLYTYSVLVFLVSKDTQLFSCTPFSSESNRALDGRYHCYTRIRVE